MRTTPEPAARGWALRCWVAAGCGDAFTGVLLLVAPEAVIGLLGEPGVAGVTASSTGPVDAFTAAATLPWRWLGVFVLGVGLVYLYPLLARRIGRPRLPVIAEVTALLRMLVAAFVTGALLVDALPGGWWSVAVTDGLLAAAQILALQRGWLEGGP
jgi:hypothetical protein